MGSPADGGISAAGAAVEQQMHRPAASASQKLSGDPLMGPSQITAATGCDHQRPSLNDLRPKWNKKSHGFSCRK